MIIMKQKYISRRNFFKLSAIISASGMIALTPSKAFGWLAFEFAEKSPIWDLLGFNNPVHEDSAQFAYSIVLQRHKNDMFIGKGPKSILNPAHKFYSKKNYNVNQYFLENLKMLRYGACWNDAATYDVLDYLQNQAGKDNILEWKNEKSPYYENLLDIAEHLVQNQNTDYNEFIQFNSNGKLDCLHGMLNSNASIEGNIERVSQSLNKNLIMQWFESAYKFAVNGENFPNTNLRYFFDTNNQYSPELDDQMLIDDSASFIDTNKTKYNTRQLRLRVLGMICHTIQDLWNPAHTIRSYYKDENDVDRFGTILAYGNYAKQNNGLISNNHKPYDLCSKADPKWDNKPLRNILIEDMTPHEGAPQRIPVDKENFLNNIINWNGSKHSKNTSINSACMLFNTLGLKYSIKYLSDFLEIAYLGLTWKGQTFYYNKNVDYNENPVSLNAKTGFSKFSSVKQWFKDFVLKDMFDFYGDSYIYDAGIKTTLSEYEIVPLVDNLSTVIESHFGEKGQTLIESLTELVNIHEQYTNLSKNFYTDYNKNGSDYLQDTAECKAKTAQDNLFIKLKLILLESDWSFKNLILPQIDNFLADLEIDQNASWNNLVKLICGFLQELYLEIDESHSVNNEISRLRSALTRKNTKISFTGIVENTWEKDGFVYTQIRNEKYNVLGFKCKKSQIDNYNDLKTGIGNVVVNCDLSSSVHESGIFIFDVDSVKIPSVSTQSIPNCFIRAKINEVNNNTFKATVLDFSKEGSSTYVFEFENNDINLEKNCEYLLTYKALNNKLICTNAHKYDDEDNEIIRHSSQIVSTYGNCLEYLVKTPFSKEIKLKAEFLDSDYLYYSQAQICGELNKADYLDFITTNGNFPDESNNDNIAAGYKKAIRIKSKNYNSDNSMDFYIPQDFQHHIKTDKKLCSSIIEECAFKDGKCIYCGNEQSEESSSKVPETSDKNGAFIAAAASAAALGAAGLTYNNSKETN